MKPTLNFKNIIFLFLCYFILGKENLICQNLISNPSFEIGEAGKPDNSSQLNLCENWVNFNGTPDWYTSKNFPDVIINGRCPTSDVNATAGSISPRTGDYFAGFWPNEGVLNRLNPSVKKNTLVKISFWANLGDNFQTELKVYLCDKAKAIDNINNENNDGKYSGTNPLNYPNDQDFLDETFLVTSFVIDPSNPNLAQSPCEWKRYESDWIFVPPMKAGDGNREYNAALIISNPENGFSKYIFIDDIRLENVNACDHPCGPTVKRQYYISDIVSSFSPNGDNDNDLWYAYIQNVVHYKLQIFDRWDASNPTDDNFLDNLFVGHGLYINEGSIPNGAYDYKVYWNGTSISNPSKVLQVGAYPVVLRAWDCNNTRYIATGSITIPGGNTVTSIPTNSGNTPYFRSNCCVENLDLKDKVIQNSFTYNVAHVINITNVTVKSGAHVIFNAGDQINRDVESEYELGSEVVENIQSCIPDQFAPGGQSQSRMARVQEPTEISKPSVSPVSEKLPNIQSIYPVPANDEIIISVSIDTPSEIILKISDITGKTTVLHHQKYYDNAGVYSYRISIANLSNGIYLYHLTGEGIFKTGKLVVLR